MASVPREAGTSNLGPSRGPLVKIFDNLGPRGQVTQTEPYYTPVDQFSAFTQGSFPNGAGGVTPRFIDTLAHELEHFLADGQAVHGWGLRRRGAHGRDGMIVPGPRPVL